MLVVIEGPKYTNTGFAGRAILAIGILAFSRYSMVGYWDPSGISATVNVSSLEL